MQLQLSRQAEREANEHAAELEATNMRLASSVENEITNALMAFESKKVQHYQREYEALMFANELLIQQTAEQLEALRQENDTWSYVSRTQLCGTLRNLIEHSISCANR